MEASASILSGGRSLEGFPLVVLDLAQVDPPGERLRFVLDEEKVAELAASIAAEGLLSPPGVRQVGERYEVVWGEHRTEALRRLGWRRAEFFVVPADADRAVVLSAVENLQRHDMSPVEEAGACKRLLDAEGGDVDRVARRLNRSRSWVDARLRVMSWPTEIQQAVHGGELSLAGAAELAAVRDEGHRLFLLGHAIRGGATVRTLQAWRIAWEQTGTVTDLSVAHLPPGGTVPAPVEAELPCYWCGDREPYGRLTHIWLCPEALEIFREIRSQVFEGSDGGSDGKGEGPGGLSVASRPGG